MARVFWGSAVGSSRGGTGSGQLRHGGAGAGACGGAGQTQGIEGALGRGDSEVV